MSESTDNWPSEIRLTNAKDQLHVTFESGESWSLPAELLRVNSPSAEVKGHHPSERKTVAGKRYVTITGIDPVGRYAIRLTFSDGHSTGIYTWKYLHELGANQDAIWRRYLAELQERGLKRD